METNKLWKPDLSARSGIAKGEAKIRIANLKKEGMKQVTCKYCGKDIYLLLGRHGARMLTMGGSEHACKDSPRGKYLKNKQAMQGKGGSCL